MDIRTSNAAHWDGWSDNYFANPNYPISLDIIAGDPRRAFPVEVYELLRDAFPDLRGVRALVPSSGDGICAFGLHLLGADVTCCDLSAAQIAHASGAARARGWDIEWRVQDSATLPDIAPDAYDLVFTSNGVHVWIDDLVGMYRAFHRALRRGGVHLMFETHPVIRPFDGDKPPFTVVKPYSSTGPFPREDGSTTFGWRTQDFVNAILDAGLRLTRMEEIFSRPSDIVDINWRYDSYEQMGEDAGALCEWERNPWAALPNWLVLRSTKEG